MSSHRSQGCRVAAVLLLTCLQGTGWPVCGAGERPPVGESDHSRLTELDALWAEVARAVREGDFEAYAASCHPEGVLVSERKGLSQPLSAALARWKAEFTATREGRMTADLEMRFTRRLGDATTAHESGIFRYTSQTKGKEPQTDFVPFDALLVKRDGRWVILMEHQKAHASQEQWDRLAP